MKSVCFIPVYNQINEFPRVLEELRQTKLPVDDILLINNGSSDGSERLVEEAPFHKIHLPKNRGIGYSFMVATEWAIKNNYDVFCVMASNGKMLPQEMHRVLTPVLSGQAHYVTGSRYLKEGESPNIPLFRQTAIPLVNIMVRFLTGVSITDATCGYKAYRLDLFKNAEFNWKKPWLETYGFEYYLYCKVLRESRMKWLEVPITMRYPPKGQSYTKMRPFISWWHMIKPWLIGRMDGKGFSQSFLEVK